MEGMEGRGGRKLVFFAQDVSDTSTVKRAESFVADGFDLTIFSFQRGRYHRDFAPPWPCVVLGRTADGRYGRRMLALLRGAATMLGKGKFLRGASAFYARNIDQLILALLARALFRRGVPVVYEVLDIQPAFVRAGLPFALLRALERFCLGHIQLLVVSSPAFAHSYYRARQRYIGPWQLLENKLPPSALALRSAAPPARARGAHKWVVGYFGLIRGDATFELMDRVAARLRGLVQFQIRGVFTTVDQARFDAMLRRNGNMAYLGEYVSPRDLGKIYGEVDFAWAIDLENAAHNSRWLLPCRFYEAGFFGVPCLGVRDFETGRWIERLDSGWVFGGALEDALVRFFETVTPEEYAAKRARLWALPATHFVGIDSASPLHRLLDKPAITAGERALGDFADIG